VSAVDLFVFVERSIFDSDAAWLAALATLAEQHIDGLAVQVRTRGEPTERALSLARDALDATRGAAVPVILNGTTQQALDLGYAAVHWPEALIPDHDEGVTLLRGASVHSPEAAARGEAAGADFLVAGTVFDAGSKPARGAGLEVLSRIAGATSLPVLAIGGVTPGRVADCVAAGAAGVAVVTYVLRAADMTAALRDLREALDEARVPGRTP
jgi:thiamine-phosphate diphosphorylase